MGKPVKVLSEVRRRPRVQTENTEPSLTVQSDVMRSDIKHVLAKYKQVGIMDHMREVDLQFRDVSEFTDFGDLMRQSADAQRAFMKLPSKVRELFHHSAAEWLDAAHDPEKLDKLRPDLERLGLVKPEPAPVVAPAAVSPAVPPA